MLTSKLKIVNGIIKDEQFLLKEIAGFEVTGNYNCDGLRSLARLAEGADAVTLTIAKGKMIRIPVEANKQLSLELHLIADELEQLNNK